MMNKYTIREGQSLFDIALQEFGAVDGVFRILADNPGLELNSNIVAGESVLIDNSKSDDLAVKNHYLKTKYKVNTGGGLIFNKIHDSSHDSSHN